MKIEKIQARLSGWPGMDYTLKKLELEDSVGNQYDRVFGFPQNYVANLGQNLIRAEFLEKILTRKIVSDETRDGINYILASDIYPNLKKDMHNLADKAQFGWLYYNKEKVSKLWELSRSYEVKYEKSKKAIKNKDILHKLLEKEAENLEKHYLKEASKEESKPWQESAWGSPKNREKLRDIGVAFAIAGQYAKAEEYLEKAGPWEWAPAIHIFEKTEQKDRAKKFCLLRAQHPTGYFEDLDRVRAVYYEKAGELEKAIEFYEKSAAGFRMQEGSYDLHGDLKPGIEAAEIDEEDAQRLKKKIEKMKRGTK